MEQHKNLHLTALTLDRQQVVAHLETLGYKQGDAVYVRAFLPKEDPRYAPNTGRKADRLNWEQVERWQAQGYGVYIVVNGGGHKDEDVKSCRAIFCEFDDRAIEDQINFWQDLGLPEPSLQIATRKSVHTYWVFDEPIAVERWRELQTALLAYTGSDPALKNPSRVMRLAGAYHIKPECNPLRCDIIHSGDKRYSYEELRAAIAVPEPLLEISPVPPLSRSFTSEGGKRYDDISIPIPATVPLEACLAKESRALLEAGVAEGRRNAQGAKLARDLIGTANYLRSIGQSFDGDPRLLLEDYANRCSPPLPLREVETVWKSAEKDNPTPSCTPEGVNTCIRAWYWKHHVKPQQESTQKNQNYAAGRGFGNTNDRGKNKPLVATITLCDRIQEILDRCESESEIANCLIELASVTGRTYNEINQLTKIIRTEGELAAEVIEAVESFRPLLKSSRRRLNISSYIDRTLSQPLMATSAAMPTAPEYLFNTVLPSSASRIGTAARVAINPQGGYTQPCIFWTANIAHSGQAKTPPQQVILKPLEEMEAAAKESHDIQIEDYENDKDAEGKPPVRLRRLLNNVTTSTKIRIHDENPRGLLEYIDELVADYQRLNQYKSGKGDDLQLELSFWNGSGGNFDRHDARLFLKRVALSKTGTYQWDTLARLMATDEVNFIASGYSSRFLYCSIVDAPARFLDLLSTPNPAAAQLREKLSWLYAQLEQLPETDYFLSHEAKVLFQGWNHTLVNAEMEEKHFGLSLVYAKIESYTARLALWLHIVNAVLRGESPSQIIDGRTMQHAIEIALFYLDQHKLIHAHNAPNRQPEGIFLKVQTQAEKVHQKCGKGVSASFLKSRINALKGWAVGKIRTCIFKALAASGHGRIEGEGSEMVYIPNPPTDDALELVCFGEELVASPIAQTSSNSDLQASIGEIGEDSAVRGFPPLRQLSGDATRVRPLPPLSEVSGGTTTEAAFSQPSTEAIASPSDHRTVASTGETPAQHYPHQFTNWVAETITVTNLDSVGDTTISSPIAPTEKTQQQSLTARELAEQILLCSTWAEIASRVKENTNTLVKAAKEMTSTQRQGLTKLLVEYLCQFPSNLYQLTWVPERLRQRAIEKLTFTIHCVTNVVEGALNTTKETISGCRLKYIDCIGMQNEVWLFVTPSGEDFYACPNAVEAVACYEQ
ncbi:DNA primase [Cyanosarcina cf. burmensis CCALA 770]|nr:DNA primase [Cyanosarcina cf. burmensis CCALA 770]